MTVEALILRPDSDALEPVTLTPDRSSGTYLAALYAALCVGLVDAIRLTDEIDAWVDDEGRVNGNEPNVMASSMLRAFGWHLAHDDAVRGSMLCVGHDGRGGMASLTDRQRDILADALAQAKRM